MKLLPSMTVGEARAVLITAGYSVRQCCDAEGNEREDDSVFSKKVGDTVLTVLLRRRGGTVSAATVMASRDSPRRGESASVRRTWREASALILHVDATEHDLCRAISAAGGGGDLIQTIPRKGGQG